MNIRNAVRRSTAFLAGRRTVSVTPDPSRGPLAVKRQAFSDGRREKGWMKVDGLFGAIFIFIYDVTLFSVHLAALRIVDPFRAEGGELCELAPKFWTSINPRYDVCAFSKDGLTAPWLGFMKP